MLSWELSVYGCLAAEGVIQNLHQLRCHRLKDLSLVEPLSRLEGENFDTKNGVTVTFGNIKGLSATTSSATLVTVVTPEGTAGESVSVVITNNGKPDVPVTLSQKFTYTDATPPMVTSTDPEDGTVLSEYEDSLNIRDSLTVSI